MFTQEKDEEEEKRTQQLGEEKKGKERDEKVNGEQEKCVYQGYAKVIKSSPISANKTKDTKSRRRYNDDIVVISERH